MKPIVILSVFFVCFAFVLHETETVDVPCDDETQPIIKSLSKEQIIDNESKSHTENPRHRNTYQRSTNIVTSETPTVKNEEAELEVKTEEFKGRSYVSETVNPARQYKIRRPKKWSRLPKQKIHYMEDEISSSEKRIIPKKRPSRPRRPVQNYVSNTHFMNKRPKAPGYKRPKYSIKKYDFHKSVKQRPQKFNENNHFHKFVHPVKQRPQKINEHFFQNLPKSPKTPPRSNIRQRPPSKISSYNSNVQQKQYSSKENQIHFSEPMMPMRHRPSPRKPGIKFPKKPSSILTNDEYRERFSLNKQKKRRNPPPKYQRQMKQFHVPHKPVYELTHTSEEYASPEEYEDNYIKDVVSKTIQDKLYQMKQNLLKKLPCDFPPPPPLQSTEYSEYSEEIDDSSKSTEIDDFSSYEDYLRPEYEDDLSSEYYDDYSDEQDYEYTNIPSGNMNENSINGQSDEFQDDDYYNDDDYDDENISESREVSPGLTTRHNPQTEDLDISKENLINVVKLTVDRLWSLLVSNEGKLPEFGKLIIDMIKTGLKACKIIP